MSRRLTESSRTFDKLYLEYFARLTRDVPTE